MAWIQLEDELNRLDRSWQSHLDALDVTLRSAEQSVLDRMDLGRGSAASWTRLFAPWTSLYPLLQAEGFDSADLHQASRLNFAHLALLVHAFIDDRVRDGQITLSDEESAFSRHCFDAALNMLNDELPDVFPDHPAVQRLLAEYQSAQQEDWSGTGNRPDASNGDPDVDATVVRIAHGRAVHGFLAPLALVLAAGCSREQHDQVRLAYDLLVTGLQWGDDVEDWEADWRAGRQNLLLARLVDSGVDLGAVRPDEDCALNARETLIRSGTVDFALDQAISCFTRASEVQGALGCPTLSRMLELLNFKIERLRPGFTGSARL